MAGPWIEIQRRHHEIPISFQRVQIAYFGDIRRLNTVYEAEIYSVGGVPDLAPKVPIRCGHEDVRSIMIGKDEWKEIRVTSPLPADATCNF